MIPFAKVRILGKFYSVETLPASPLENQFYGMHNAAAGTIHVQEDLSPGQEADTLLHECLHGIDYAMALGLEERQVHAMAAGVLALLRDNPGLAGWLAPANDEPTTSGA